MDKVEKFAREVSAKLKVVGDEYEIGCPFEECPNHGETQFYINSKTEKWQCKRCNRAGHNLKQLQFQLGMVERQEPKKVDFVFVPEQEVEKMHQDLLDNEELMGYLTNIRRFTLAGIKQFRLGFVKGATDKEDAIIYPYFDDKDRCVGWKERYWKKEPKDKPKAKFKYKTKKIAYNLNNITKEDTVIIVEGEGDAVALWCYGFSNVISCPQGKMGASDWLEGVKGASNYILFYDNDGDEGVEVVAKQLGRVRCKRAYPSMKDVGEMLAVDISRQEVGNILDSSEPMLTPPVSDITTHAGSLAEIMETPERIKGVPTGWNVLDEYLGGFRTKELTIISGNTGNGKTTFSLALMSNLAKQGLKSLIVSPEMEEEMLYLTLCNNRLGRKASPEDVLMMSEDLQGLISVANVYGKWTDKGERESLLDTLLDTLAYSVDNDGTKFIFIDHLHLFVSARQSEAKGDIDNLLKELIRFAMINDVHIFLVVQPRKASEAAIGGKEGKRKITKSDLKGSSNLETDPHNILLLHRDPSGESTEVEFSLEKNRRYGKLGTFYLDFDTESMANYTEMEET